MAGKGKDVVEGSRTRRPIDLNLYVGLPPLPPPTRVWLAGTSSSAASLMPSSSHVTSQAPRTGGEPEESLLAPAVAAAYSPSNALSVPEEHPTLDPVVYSWLDGSSSAGGEEYTYALQPPTMAPVAGANVSEPQLPWLEGDDDLAVVRSVRPSRWAAAVGGQMEIANNTSTLVQWSGSQGATIATEVGPLELRLRSVIQISQQHNIVVWPRSSANNNNNNNNNNQEATSSEDNAASQLARAIQHTQSLSSEAAATATRGQNNPDDGSCDCNASFECYICLEVARQPVVTPCGHLFCWACLYRWLHEQSTLGECPVCKGEVLRGDITPIYGRGGGREEEEGDLPPRPQAQRRNNVGEQLQRAGSSREMAAVLRLMIANQNQRGWGTPIGGLNPAPAWVEEHWVPEPRQRAPGARRQQRNQGNSAEHVMVLAAPPAPQQQPMSVDEPGPSRRSRPPESHTMRRTRRRPQP